MVAAVIIVFIICITFVACILGYKYMDEVIDGVSYSVFRDLQRKLDIILEKLEEIEKNGGAKG